MILVTGGTGLVGGHLLWHLLQENETVIAIRRPSSNLKPLHTIFSSYSSNPDDFLSRIDWRMADVLIKETLHEAMHNVSLVYHCAAVVSLANKTDILMDTNVIGTRNIVQVALEIGVKKLCFVSSISACGKANKNGIIDESCIWTDNPHRTTYSRSKYYSEQEVWKGIEKGLNAVIVNPGVILGISGTNTGSSQLFSQVQKGLIFYTNGGSGYVYVKDVVKAMSQLMNSEIASERFVLVGENCSNKDVLNWIANGLGKHRPRFLIGKRTLWTVGILAEVLGKLFHFMPLIDRETARTATHRDYYSSLKIKDKMKFSFTTVEQSIAEICKFIRKEHRN